MTLALLNPAAAAAADNPKKAKKKKHRSKHIIEAQKQQEQEAANRAANNGGEGEDIETTTNMNTNTNTNSTPNKKKKKSKGATPTKDFANEAISYLSLWNEQQKESNNENKIWKYHKNTQTWLFKSMYKIDKVSKASFAILMEYMKNLQGESTKEWVRKEAYQRALRYKQYEEQSKKKDNDDDSNNDTTEDNGEAKDSANDTTTTSSSSEFSKEENERWAKLDDHEKRKEYKRARKVIEIISSTSDEN